jgi:alanyl-tRNA synthetase
LISWDEDYGELIRARSFILGVVENEERRFADTLRYSMKVLKDEIEKLQEKGEKVIPGDVVFRLYDTYGLAVDLVEDVARDEKPDGGSGRLQSGHGETAPALPGVLERERRGGGSGNLSQASIQGRSQPFFRLRYPRNRSNNPFALILEDQEVDSIEQGAKATVILDQTPFYAESGGQVGDVGLITKGGQPFSRGKHLKIRTGPFCP